MPSNTYVTLVVDKSSSMGGLTAATISGFNEYINTLKQDPQYLENTIVSLIQFSDGVYKTFSNTPLSKVEELNEHTYIPNGMTALYDGIGAAISDLKKRVKKKDKAIVVVITDGYENASGKYDSVMIKSAIQELEAQGNWTFSYLGATVDAFDVGVRTGFKAGNTARYAGTAAGTQSTYSTMALNTSQLRSGAGGQSANFTQGITADDDEDKVTTGSTPGTTSS